MQYLTFNEIEMVAGGGDVADATQAGAGLGGLVGASLAASAGGSGTAVLGAAGLGAAVGGGLAAAGAVGYAAGSWLNENTPIQSWIAKGLDSVLGGSGTKSTMQAGADLDDALNRFNKSGAILY